MKKTKAILAEIETNGDLIVNIGGRGGNLGAAAEVVFSALKIPETYLANVPPKLGVVCNYLGGGIRGAIFPSATLAEFTAHGLPATYAKRLAEFCNACIERYQELENETGLNDDNDENPNWDAKATALNRTAGVVSAY